MRAAISFLPITNSSILVSEILRWKHGSTKNQSNLDVCEYRHEKGATPGRARSRSFPGVICLQEALDGFAGRWLYIPLKWSDEHKEKGDL